MDPRRRALLDTISYAEGTWRGGGSEGYRVMFGGGLADPGRSGGGHPDTVINGGRVSSAAAGRYQFMPDTWKAASQAVGVKPNQFFDPAAQDKAADYLVSRRLGGAQLGDSLTPEIAGKLAPEWASFPTAGGGSYYPNQSVKKLGELDSFYRQRLASLRGGGDNSLAATSGGRSQVAGEDGSGLVRALLGDDAPEPRKPATGKTRFAAVELSPLGAMEQANPSRKAGDGLPELTADNDPFVAAMNPGKTKGTALDSTPKPGDGAFAAMSDDGVTESVTTDAAGRTLGKLTSLAEAAGKFYGTDSRSGPDDGNNACLYMVNKVIRSTGATPPWGNSQYVPDARKALAQGNGILLRGPEPGAIAIMRDNYGNPDQAYPHIGVVGSDGRIISNSSSRGKFDWSGTSEDYGRYYGREPEFWKLK
jgi:muramidase (phage lysozyme)